MLTSIEFVVLNTAMSLLSAFIVYYLLSKKAEKTIDFYKKQLKSEAETWLNSETGAKALYSIGMMIAAGGKQSLGLNFKGGKFRWQDIVAQIGIEWAKKSFPDLIPEPGNIQQKLNNPSKDRAKRLGSA